MTPERSGGRPSVDGRTVFLVLSRAANTLFFAVTATYCILTYSSFAYQQFIRPHLVSALSSFVVWHHLWHWVMLGLTIALVTTIFIWNIASGHIHEAPGLREIAAKSERDRLVHRAVVDDGDVDLLIAFLRL